MMRIIKKLQRRLKKWCIDRWFGDVYLPDPPGEEPNPEIRLTDPDMHYLTREFGRSPAPRDLSNYCAIRFYRLQQFENACENRGMKYDGTPQ